jgi:hypothetical protein
LLKIQFCIEYFFCINYPSITFSLKQLYYWKVIDKIDIKAFKTRHDQHFCFSFVLHWQYRPVIFKQYSTTFFKLYFYCERTNILYRLSTQTKILKCKSGEAVHHKISGTYARTYMNSKEDVGRYRNLLSWETVIRPRDCFYCMYLNIKHW